MPENVIFDMDGVLVDSEPLHWELEQILFKELGIKITSEYHDKLVGTSPEKMWETITSDFQLKYSVAELVQKEKQLKLAEMEKREIKTNPGVKDLIKELYDEKVPLSVGSSSPVEIINLFLRKTGLEEYFDYRVSSEEVANGKPAPDIFRKIASAYGKAAEKFVVIEDSQNGVAAAKAAGMSCVGYKSSNSGKQDLSAADLVIKNFGELSSEILLKLKRN